MKRPIVLLVLALTSLVVHHLLLRAAAHGHVAHVLLGMSSAAPADARGAATLAIALLIARFVTLVVVPGLFLAAAAEIVAYLLVGPKGPSELDEG